jgi:hypothetical protein
VLYGFFTDVLLGHVLRVEIVCQNVIRSNICDKVVDSVQNCLDIVQCLRRTILETRHVSAVGCIPTVPPGCRYSDRFFFFVILFHRSVTTVLI